MGLRKLDTEGLWMVNSNPIYIPDVDVSIEHNHLADEGSGRDEQGYMHIQWLRRNIAKVGIKYAVMTGEELTYMRELMQGQEFSFTYPDENEVRTIQGYTGDIKATLYTRFNGVDVYKDVSINVIEL